MKSKVGLTLSLLVLVGIFLYSRMQLSKSPTQNLVVTASTGNPVETIHQAQDLAENVQNKFQNFGQSQTTKIMAVNADVEATFAEEEQAVEATLHPGFELEDGVAVVEGDIVLGEPRPGQKYTGFSQGLQTWSGGVVPFIIQGDLEKPERVIQAISAFIDTGIKFIPYSGQGDALVFQAGNGNCKSYVGKVGGMQPLWVAPGCGTKELIHEIMHALGFIHEQNRADRDSFIEVLWPHITETAKKNFEKFPDDMMKVSGLGAFDFQSVMIYPPSMFSKEGQPTMRSKSEGIEIFPSAKMSIGDVLRLQRLSKSN